ncbi:MAG: nucleotidyl transferase AbiEii/AbiGii toxin family protein [Bacteroidota bacterium]
MMEMEQIQRWFPEELHDRKEDMLREYLQFEILQLLFDSKFGHKYTFLGGTCLRIVYGTDRFSEDLDFDNVGLSEAEFEETARIIRRGLELKGYVVSLKYAYKGAFHCNIKFPGLLYAYDLSGHKEAKMLIKLDTEKQGFEYKRQLFPLNKFGLDSEILVTPLPLLCAQKMTAALGRKRPKGRDFYDLSWILEGTPPNYDYLQDRLGFSTPEDLKVGFAQRISTFDFEALAKDVEPFLFLEGDIERVRNFPTFWQKAPL